MCGPVLDLRAQQRQSSGSQSASGSSGSFGDGLERWHTRGTMMQSDDQQICGLRTVLERAWESEPVEEPMTPSKQRRVVRIFPRGSFVEIWSDSQQRWALDGEVAEIAWSSLVSDGVQVSAGSTKVVYGDGKYYRWVRSPQLHGVVRKSDRPRRPEPEVGHVMWKTRSLLGGLWKWSYVLLHSGRLQWWSTKEEAAAGAKPAGVLHLLGLQLEKDKFNITLHVKSDERGDRVTKHTFKVQEEDWVDTFVESLQAHAEWCEEDKLFFDAQPSLE